MATESGRRSAPRGEPSNQDTGSMTGRHELARRLGAMARTLQDETDVEATLATIVQSAVRLIPGVEEGSISIVFGRSHVSSRVPSGDLPDQIDQLQTTLGEGPCLDAAYEQQTVRVSDLRHEQRWPRFTRGAYDLGARAMLAIQLFVEHDNLGALNLYSRQPNAFDDESEHIGLIFASHAAVALADAQEHEHLHLALSSRDLIGQAKGILMERYDLDASQAFAVLTRYSQESNRKLRDICAEISERAPDSK